MSCHPAHVTGPPDRVHNTEEEIEKNWAEFRKADEVDSRAIRRQHKFKPGHGPHDDNPHDPWTTLNIKFEGEHADPDQRDQLSGGPPSGLPCEQCGTMTTVCGEKTMWEVYSQPGVEVVNLESMTAARKKELQEMKVVILCCPQCKAKSQWLEEFLPKGLGHGG